MDEDKESLARFVARAEALRPYVKDAGDRWAEANAAPTAAAERCRRHRLRILEVSRQVSAAHISPAFSCVEIVDALYYDVMRDGDIFIMSKGHGCLAQYVVLEALGRLPRAALDAYCKLDGRLGAHPDYDLELGIHASTGSLGHGLGIAAGQALAEKMRGTGVRVFVLLSDGECQEGSTWEAAMVAANLGLDNLCVVVDANDWGGMERMSRAFPALEPLAAKFRAFGWWCPLAHRVSGHDVSRDSAMVSRLLYGAYRGLPRAIICATVKGKGVSFMEAGQPLWHYRSPTDAEYAQAVAELGG